MIVRYVLLAMFGFVGSVASAADPMTMPLLQLETGMHTASINRIATDVQGRWLVTASDDKTARIWEVATGREVQVLRPPQDEGNEGKLYAVAMSPDGATVAVAGWTGVSWDSRSIYVFDRASGSLVRRMGGLPNVVFDLAISRDGRLLAAGLGSRGVRVFELASGSVLGKDEAYSGGVYSVDFDRTGERLLSTSAGGTVRIHAIEARGLRTVWSKTLGTDISPRRARFSPDGAQIAVGLDDAIDVSIYDGELRKIRSLETRGIDGPLQALAWSADGESLIAGGTWKKGGSNLVRRWQWKEKGRFKDHAVSENAITDLVALPAPAGGWLFGSGAPNWGLIGSTGELVRREDARVADFRGQRAVFGLSADGCGARFRYVSGANEVGTFDACALKLGTELSNVSVARVIDSKVVVQGWENGLSPTVDGLPLSIDDDERSRALAFVADGQRFVIGTDFSLWLFDQKGSPIWERAAPDAVWAVNVTGDGRFAVAAYGDGTIRWHSIANQGREVLAFFPHADRKRWVAWTPEGFFAASPGADELIGYHLNRGKESEGELVTARQLWETFYQPDLVSRRLSPEGNALIDDAMKKVADVRSLLVAAEVPEISLESAADAVIDGEYNLKLRVSKKGRGTLRIVVRIDGNELPSRPVFPALTPGGVIEFPVALSPGPHVLSAEAVNESGVASPVVRVNVESRAQNNGKQPVLHVFAVGISKYRDVSLNSGVTFAADDASSVAETLGQRAIGIYRHVNKMVLRDDRAKREDIESAVEKMGESVAPEDTVVFYLAGHGFSTDSNYHFVPQAAIYTNEAALKQQSLDSEQLRALLTQFKANKVLVLLDTCSSGAFKLIAGRDVFGDKIAMERLARLSGRAMIAAAADKKMAVEGAGDHGVFTAALLAALTEEGDDNKNGEIDVAELSKYIVAAVPAITKRKWGYEQVPMTNTEGSFFPVVKAATAK